ncbi:MAG: AAA family ATPase [Patescibacteria group bacterium]
MYLRRLELQGFKAFAQKTVLEFLPDAGARRGLTAVVGPNGSGKSNVADAIRWVMGEQSMKLLRGKRAEDVIFSGTDKKPRAGFAEVRMTLVNDDHPDIDLPEIVIARRLYRDGQSEYEVNRKTVRLTDVVLLLAQAGIGQRTYSVIGQGMADAILSASPSERKQFFDEASGIRPFQLKRSASISKLEATKENLRQAELLLREIGPRLSSLERQAKRLQQREGIEEELRDLERTYFGGVWHGLRTGLHQAKARTSQADAERIERAKDATRLESELATLEKATPPSEGFREIRKTLDGLTEERVRLRERQLRLEASEEVAQARAEKTWSPLSLSRIIEEVEAVRQLHDVIWKALAADTPNVATLKKIVAQAKEANEGLISKLQRPAPEAPKERPIDPAVEQEIRDLAEGLAAIQQKVADAERRLDEWNRGEETKRTDIFALQHKLTAVRNEAAQAERRASDAAVEMARIDTRREGFLQDLRTNAPQLEAEIDAIADAAVKATADAAPETLGPKISRMRSQLEWIGGIDPEVLKEYEDTKKRFEDLATQSDDLKQAMTSLDTIIAELDVTIKERTETSFRLLDREFGQYFKKLFGGGEARLVEIAPEPELDMDGNVVKDVAPDAGSVGIDIQATPPGKRLTSIALLSGGERALTSIALICAIMATNPSPFVVLDEVDAALDEANSRKYADILNTLADRTQFVVITHNRATIQQAHVLYGVTMGQDGVSQLLSVKLDDVVKET